MEMINQVAIRKDGQVHSLPRPARHVDLLHKIRDAGEDRAGYEYGFLTNVGRFVDRFEAWEIAQESGQMQTRNGRPLRQELHSELLW
jgi:hypothetical protein